jgi:putative DNA primase/helicase
LRLTRTWYGSEDTKLLDKLTDELAGVLWWGLEGWRRLEERGTLLQPESSADALADLEDLASPINAFLRDRCRIGSEETVAKSDLYAEYQDWCKDIGHKHVLDTASFGRDLHAAVPTLRTTHPRIDGEQIRHYVGVGLRPIGV